MSRHDWIHVDELAFALDGMWARRLATNLAIGAALCRADTIGFARGIRTGLFSGRDAWRPGCGKIAP